MAALTVLAGQQAIFEVLDVGTVGSHVMAQVGFLLRHEHVDEQLAGPMYDRADKFRARRPYPIPHREEVVEPGTHFRVRGKPALARYFVGGPGRPHITGA